MFSKELWPLLNPPPIDMRQVKDLQQGIRTPGSGVLIAVYCSPFALGSSLAEIALTGSWKSRIEDHAEWGGRLPLHLANED